MAYMSIVHLFVWKWLLEAEDEEQPDAKTPVGSKSDDVELAMGEIVVVQRGVSQIRKQSDEDSFVSGSNFGATNAIVEVPNCCSQRSKDENSGVNTASDASANHNTAVYAPPPGPVLTWNASPDQGDTIPIALTLLPSPLPQYGLDHRELHAVTMTRLRSGTL